MKYFERLVRSPVAWLLAAGLAVSAVSLVIFFVETGNLSDEKLMILHTVLRYSFFAVFICSLYIIIISIYNIISRKIKIILCIIYILVSLVLMVFSIGIFYLESFILVFSGGTL